MTSRSTLLAAVLFVAACAAPAAPAPQPPATPASTASTPLVAPGDAKVGDRTKCPVSGEEFVVAAESPKAEYGGKTYYFCCPGCAKKFGADPAKFTGPASPTR